MAVEKVKEHLKKYGLDGKIVELSSSLATVHDAAESLGCSESEIAKTMAFSLSDGYIVVVMSGDVKIDNSKYKATFHEKAHMVSPEILESVIGHPMGGVCPFALNEGVKVYLDESLKRFSRVYPSCGSIHNAIGLTLEELERASEYTGWVDITKKKEV
ncbi:TPA: YbaK/EbsC family protein [Candidatus Ventrenecus avicola]|nr:YbaK/EbsC family protein [Candidatus Ventrenecus avicola]